MNWEIFFVSFGTIFLAELGDKTSLAGMSLSAKSGSPLAVWLGSVSAYLIVTAIAVVVGVVFGKYVKPEIVRYISALLFVVIGILMFLGKI